VGPDGQVLLTYVKGVPGATLVGPAEVVVHLDPDGLGLEPFGSPVVASTVNIGSNLPIPAQAVRTIDTEGNLAWDRSDGQHRGRVYLVYTDSPAVGSADTDIFIRASDDSGQNWGEPIQVHDDDPLSQFLPSVAVDQSTGNVGVGWHTAVEPANVRTRFTATLSDDGGSTFRLAYLVSPGDSDATNPVIDPRGANFQYGDYTGIAFVDGVLQPIWADNSAELAANPDPPRFDLANARIAVAEVTRAPLVVETFNVEDVEGNGFTAHVATFTDPEGGGAASDYKATIHWGDGSEDSEGTIQQQPDGSFNVLGTHQYEDFGTYSISITITGSRTRGEGTATATIENAPLDVVIPAGLRVVREMEFTKVVATLSDLNLKSTASDFIVTIEWGDGSGSLATLELQPGSGEAGAPNTFNISGTHKYLSEETFTINVSVLERASGQVLARQGELVSGDPPLIVNPGQFLDIEALAGINTGDLVLVTFERPDDIEVPLDTTVGEYTATINWGDGNVDAGITPFVTSEDVTVVGRHTYTTAGAYFPTVTLVDDSGGFFSAPLIATVELDVTSVVRAVGSGLIYNPATERFVGELTITNTSGADLPGPFFAVFHDLPEGVTLANITDVTGEEDPLAKVSVLKLQPGESLDPIPLEFDNPGRVPITYRVQVFDGIRSGPSAAASLSFEPNLGQTDAQVAFVARGSNYAIFLTPDRAALGLGGTSDGDSAAVHMLWLGGNESPTVIAMEPQAGTSNYLIGPDPSGWITSVPQYGRIRYESVYDRIDLEYYGRAGELEYDWIVRPGGDPNDIIMQFAGAESMTIDNAGNLRLTVADSELVERAPLVYQEIAGQRVDIPGSYVIHPDGMIGFELAAYDTAETLVIDPVLIYSTFFGPDATAQDVVVDDAGNAYITGTTVAIDFPTSAGVFQEESIDAPDLVDPLGRFYSRVDAFVLKVDPKGVPMFSTYLSGNYDDIGNAIAVDAARYVYVAGNTTSTMFPTQNAFQANHADDRESEGFLTLTSDVFLTKLSPDGSRAEYSTYLGGQGNDVPSGIAVDATGAVYVVGSTAAADFPTKNAVLPFHPFDAFITKFDPSGSSLAFSTFLGGSSVDEAVGIVLDSSGDITVVGNTTSVDLPTHNALFDAYKPYTGPDSDLITALDLFVARLPADGSALDVLTYLGGTGGDEVFAIARDDEGNIYLGGQTWSQDLPLVNPLQDSLNGQFDGFVVKLDPDLASILYSTYFGGSGREFDGLRVFDAIHDIAVDAQGNLIVAGETDSADLPVTAAIQPELAGESDWFLASLNATGSALNYLTYFGGADYDYLNAMAIDRAGTAVMTGRTLSEVDLAFDFPTFRAFDSTVGTTEFFANRMVFAKVASEPPPGFNRLELVHRTIAAVEGSTLFDGLVASVITVGTETAEDFTASINWGDGIVSAGTVVPGSDPGIPGRRQFSVLGSHLYEDVGLYDVVVTVRDSAGNPATATSTAAPQHGEDHALYHVVIDTTSLAGQSGLFSVQFNPGALPDAPNAELTLSGFSANGGVLSPVVETEGAASGDLADGATLQPTSLLNRLTQGLTFGQRIELDVRIAGEAIADPSLGPFGNAIGFQLLAADGVTPLLTVDSSGAVLTVLVDSDGATRSEAALFAPDAPKSVAAASTSNIASVANAPLDVLLTPFSVQEGAEFSGTVATFTNENPLEALAGEHQAVIDWGDGSPATAGVITADSGHFLVTGTHRYRTAGEYPFHVTVTEPDGASVSGSESIAGNHFEASLLASIGALFA
ncbi:MAG: hypothetical protein GXY83_17505, partial [Rhodopirellula sp.]|nr:hypothetical protein [Rhodopirellula sp.]